MQGKYSESILLGATITGIRVRITSFGNEIAIIFTSPMIKAGKKKLVLLIQPDEELTLMDKNKYDEHIENTEKGN